MKIETETKFDKDQEVFVLWSGEVVKGNIESAEFFGGWMGPGVSYSILGLFFTPNFLCYVKRDFEEKNVFSTKQEALVELNKVRKYSIDKTIQGIKDSVCTASRRYKICECQDERQRKIIRALKKWNSELNKMIKEN